MKDTETAFDNTLALLDKRTVLYSHGTVSDRTISRVTIVVEVRTVGRFLPPMDGMREKRPFWNVSRSLVAKVLWWKNLQLTSYRDAKLYVLSILHKLAEYRDRGLPLKGFRIFLVDWDKDRAVSRRDLGAPWFYTKTSDGLLLDAQRLRAWGIAIDTDAPKEEPKVAVPRFDMREATRTAARGVISDIPRWLKNAGVMQVQLKDRSSVLAGRRIITLVSSDAFQRDMQEDLQHKFLDDKKLQAKWMAAGARDAFITYAKEYLWQKIVEKLNLI